MKKNDPFSTEGAFDDMLQMEIDPEDIVYLVKALTLCHNLGLKADRFTQGNILQSDIRTTGFAFSALLRGWDV